MKQAKKLFYLTLALSMGLLCASCGGDKGSNGTALGGGKASPDDYFSWLGSNIAGLSDKGAAAANIVVPASAEAVNITITENDAIKSFSFEDPNANVTTLVLNYCTALESVSLPTTVASVNCAECPALTSVTIPEGVPALAEGAFHGCSALAEITLPESITVVPEAAFGQCTGLTTVTLPDTITEIDRDAFLSCTSLTSLDFPAGLKTIDQGAFHGCRALTSVTLPEGLESIAYDAFGMCDDLVTVKLPESVTKIDESAFMKAGTEGQEPFAFQVKAGSWADENSDYFSLSGTVTTY